MTIDRTQFNLLVDDSGAGVDGSTWDKAKIQAVLLDPIDTLVVAPVSFTPTIVSSGGGTPTYSVQVAKYRKLDGLIHITGRVTLATFGTLAAGSVTIGGLPVASVNTTNLYSMVSVSWFAMTTSVVFMSGLIAPNTSAISLQHLTVAATGATVTQKSDLSATSDFIFSALYPSS